MEETSVLNEIVYLDPDYNARDLPMIGGSHETSILNEILYLDPELNGDAEYFSLYFRFGRAATWEKVRQFVTSPCVATLAGFVVLMIIGANHRF